MDRSGKFWKKFYEGDSRTYDEERFSSASGKLFAGLENEFIGEMFGGVRGKSVLDVATGTGRISVYLAKKGAKVTALDLTPEMMAKAKGKARRERVKIRFVEGNALRLPFRDDSFDRVISIRFLHLLSRKDERRVIEEMTRVLKPGGLLIIEYNNLLYGGFLIPIIEAYRVFALKRNAERFVLPFGFRLKHLQVEEVAGIGFPALGRVTRANPKLGWRLGKKMGRNFMKNFSSHLVIKCRKTKRK
ncbi:hypothetical protein COX86_00445 [Candidatus Micrarchaeota archaeon CG_4_10_14_0_2_um_filter_60_11]|nr:MAG: hypothetical protein AUJ16_00815 [Candidatus Micrarchaeota archaeon CG1_02_60_51]PIZ91293.1 MAG: hypothetical protein COX86_00445 [Candidatus Micrarchaeota archaeon CG_4_10_14_0_2_um_filter_60_11]